MIGWLFDTNVVSEVARPDGSRRVRGWADGQPASTLYVSILTLAEYERGIVHLPEGDPRRTGIERLRDRIGQRFTILPVSDAVILRWGAMSGLAKRLTRQSPPVVDTLLAATAVEHDLYLVTRNFRDVRHSGAAVFNPWTDDPTRVPLAPRI